MASNLENAQKPFLKVSDIKERQLQFGIDNKPIVITEECNALRYCTPHFRISATLEIPPLPSGVNIKVGWIQVCGDRQCTCTYGSYGIASWEFPEMISGKYEMLSDSDETEYPWYGSDYEVSHLQGPTQNVTVTTVHMDDNFSAQMPWFVPVSGYSEDPCLTFVYRNQRFYTYLALKDVNTSTYQIIKAITWTMEFAIDVQPLNPMGKRTKLLGPFQQECPKVLPAHLTPPLKCYALKPPCSNACQVLVWRPRYGDNELVVPPYETTVDLKKYLVDTKDYIQKLLRINKTNFLNRSI